MPGRSHPWAARGRFALCAIVGCGSLSKQYARTLTDLGVIEIVACHDADRARGQDLVARIGCARVADLDEVLAAQYEVTVNPMPFAGRADITRRAIHVGGGPCTARLRWPQMSGRPRLSWPSVPISVQPAAQLER